MSNQSRGRTGGVLPINAVATKKANAPQKSSQRSPAPRLRLIIRRLPPGLTEAELWEALGSEWQTGNGKVTWHVFKEGKISKDPSKPSRPGRVYIKVKDQSLLDSLSAHVRTTTFRDAKNTNNDSCLVGPPSLEFAPYSKVPSGRNRHDGRQGTIDQDQEFIDFLQSLTEPITKPATNGVETGDMKSEKVVTTPLVQFIKEKKANKAKEKEAAAAAAAKSSKKNQEGKEGKGKEPRPTVVVKSNAAAAEKAKVAKATQEAVKAANKSAAQVQSKATASKTEPKSAKETPAATVPAALATSATSATSTPVTVQKPERQRGNASAASRMIARDLGLTPKEPRTPRVARNVNAATPATTESTTKPETRPKNASPTPAATTKTSTTSTSAPASVPTPAPTPAAAQAPTPPTGPKTNRSGQTPQTKSTQPAAQRQGKTSSQPTAGAKSAFLKHANPSQGVTEELLRTTFSSYGEVTRCEIDKKKGLGYVDFTDTEALKKAMAASPVKVGNGQVVVLENKSPYHKRQAQPGNPVQQQAGAPKSTSRAASVTSSAVASAVTSPQPVQATIAKSEPAAIATVLPAVNTTVEPSTLTEAASASISQPATPSTPTAPKGGRSGNSASRGGRGGATSTSGRGNFNQSPNRGRGGFRGRGGRGRTGANAGANAGSASLPSTPTISGVQSNNGEDMKPASAEKA